jgi:hypothetical protein
LLIDLVPLPHLSPIVFIGETKQGDQFGGRHQPDIGGQCDACLSDALQGLLDA